MNQHPVIADLSSRKTSKRYDPTRVVPREKMEVLYEALRLTASSINSQPWKFIVIESEAAKQRMKSTFARFHKHNAKHVTDGSHVILLAHNPSYTREDYGRVVDNDIANGRAAPEDRERALEKYAFAESKTNAEGSNADWARAQVYIALGNALHVLARLSVDGTPMEGIDSELIGQEFREELDGYVCDVALVVGYHHADDLNAQLPKSRLPMEQILQVL